MQYPTTITDINHHIANMRLLKDAYDIKRITTACNISVNAHLQAMRKVKSCNYEYELEAILLQEFYAHGSRYPAYTSIVGGGKNACVLHYVSNDAKLNSGELVLIDAGCEYMGYASDITRTYPVNGRFTKAQQKIYEIVLAANKAAIAEVRLGNEWNKPADTAVNVITQGLIDLGILQGEVKENIEAGHYKQFYMHAIGHWLGLDVHDVGSYKVNGTWRKYEASMCTTIEPGIYIRPHANVKEEYWNIGVRIEDDILLTTNGAVNLTQGVPKEVTELEQVISGH